jgi:hypothetical protein
MGPRPRLDLADKPSGGQAGDGADFGVRGARSRTFDDVLQLVYPTRVKTRSLGRHYLSGPVRVCRALKEVPVPRPAWGARSRMASTILATRDAGRVAP